LDGIVLWCVSVSKSTRKAGRPALITRLPDAEQVPLRCPACDDLLTFIDAIIGGVKPVERWDRYVCPRCGGGFEYRPRTRKLKRAA
jgi:hypothetical protein